MNHYDPKEALKHPIISRIFGTLSDRLREYQHQQKRVQNQIILNRLFTEGKQWNTILPHSNELYEPLQDEGEVRLTWNIVLPIVNMFRAEIMARRLTWQAEAYNADETKIESAEVMTQVTRQHYFDFEQSGRLAQHIDAIDIDGVHYLTVDYFPDAGEIIDFDSASGQPIKEGKIMLRLVSALDLFCRDEYPDLQTQPCVIEACRMQKAEVKRMWPNVEEVAASSLNERRIDQQGQTYNQKDKEEEAIVWKFWFKAGNGALEHSPDLPNGLCLVWLQNGNQLLDVTDFPFPFDKLGMYPFVDFHCIRRRERYHSQGIPEQIEALQVEINKTISTTQEAKNYIGNPVWLMPKSIGINNVDEIPTYPGGVIFYAPDAHGTKPEMAAPPPIPQYIQDLPQNLASYARSILNANEIAQAQQPGSTNSYSGLQLLSNIQAKILTPYLQDYANKWSLVGKILGLMEQKYTDIEKQLRVTDDLADLSLKKFYSNADLIGDFDLIVRVEPEVESLSARKQAAIQELQAGAIDKDEYNSRIYGKADNQENRTEIVLESLEIEAMKNGQVVDNVPFVLYENHKVRWPIIARFIQSPAFKLLPPPVQQAARKHADVHWMGVNQPDQLMQKFVMPELIQYGIATVPQIPIGNPADGTTPGGGPVLAGQPSVSPTLPPRGMMPGGVGNA